MCSLVAQFEKALINCKQTPAIAYWDDQNTYKTLSFDAVDEISKNIIKLLRSFIAAKYACVGLYMEHNPLIPSLVIRFNDLLADTVHQGSIRLDDRFSLQKCNLAFIFLDPHTSEKNNLAIIRRLNLKWIISYHHNDYTNFFTKHVVKQADLDNLDLHLWSVDCVTTIDNSFKETCFVVCTSGTTGDPKVVKVQHGCITANITSLRNKFELTHNDVIYFGTPLTFDPSMVELFLALSSGCSLLIAPRKIKINPSRLLNTLFPKEGTHKGVTVLQIVPSLFLRWSEADIKFILHKTTCRVLAFGGEKFPESVLKLGKAEGLRIFNLYGITEVSCWASLYEVKDGHGKISLGEPLDETILEVRSEDGGKVGTGEGELYIGSCSRICYINDEIEMHLAKPIFRSTGDIVTIDNKGIFYMCRKNSIIKRLGHRVNLLEIEETILAQTKIPSTCLWLDDKSKLVVFFALAEFNLVTKRKIIDKLRVKLLHTLPKQCFPDHMEIIPSFPLTRHGKINRKSLLEIFSQLSNDLSTKDAATVFLLLCGKYLGLSLKEMDNFRDCNFFDVGGNSILAIQLLSEFKEATGVDFSNDLTTLLFEKTLGECYEFATSLKVVTSSKRQHSPHPETASNSKDRILKKPFVKTATTEQSNLRLKICWQHNLEACVDSSPMIIESRKSTMVVVGSFSHIFAILDAQNGEVASQIVLPDAIEGACCVSPLYSHVYTGCYDGKVYCIDFQTSKVIWDYSTGDRIKCTPCLCLENEAIACGSYDKSVHCVNVHTGTLLWKTPVMGSVTSSPLCYKERIYVATIFGACLCLAENTGKVLWKHDVAVPIFGSPCTHPTRDSITWPGVNGTLHSFSCATGNKEDAWIFEAKGNIYSSLTRHEDCVIFGCHDHKVYCVQFNESGCWLKYTVAMDSAISASPGILQDRKDTYIVAATNSGNICVIDFRTGKLIGCLRLCGEVFSSPAVKDDRVYVGCRDNNLYCLSVTVDDD